MKNLVLIYPKEILFLINIIQEEVNLYAHALGNYIFQKKFKKFSKKLIPCANLPVGFWKYDKNLFVLPKENVKNEEIPILENQIPEIDKY